MKNRTQISVIVSSFLFFFLTIGLTSSYAQENDAKKQKKIEKQRKAIHKAKAKGLKELYK